MDFNRIVRSGWIRLQRRWQDLSPEEARRGQADLAILAERLPFLEGYSAQAERSAGRFAADHEDYCANVGHPVHAASLELVAFLDVLCRSMRPARVVDLGSGFTSYVLRQYAADAEYDVEVWSVDDSEEWLGKSVDYVAGKGLDTANLTTWQRFHPDPPKDFDLVVHDMGSMQTRAETLLKVLDLAKEGGVVILDDMHKPEFRAHALEALAVRGTAAYSLKPLTRDDLTRYAYLCFG